MKRFLLQAAILPVIIIAHSFCSLSAQPEQTTTTTTAKTLTQKDKEVIIEIFKTIDVKLYHFSFSQSETYGKGVLPIPFPASLRNGGQPTLSGHIVKSYYPTVNFWYVVAEPAKPAEGLEGIFGKANAARLNAVINKYTAADK